MNTNDKTSGKFFRIAATVILGSVFATGSALANELGGAVPSEKVQYQELNLDSPAGAAALYSRIHKAALRVCSSGSRDLARLSEEKSCAIDAEVRAVRQVNVSGLTAYFQAKTGHVVATLAGNMAE